MNSVTDAITSEGPRRFRTSTRLLKKSRANCPVCLAFLKEVFTGSKAKLTVCSALAARFSLFHGVTAGHQRLRRKWAGLALLAILISSVNFVSSNPVQAQAANEYEVKAAVLYNFVKFVEWPSEAFSHGGAPFVVGVIGADPFGSAIDQTINGKTVNGHHITVRRLKWGQNMRDCHILFVSSSEQKRLPQILESLKGASVLTVSEMDRFSQQGGIIGLVMENSKVQFEINKAAADQARLKISSRLLELARKVITGKGRGD